MILVSGRCVSLRPIRRQDRHRRGRKSAPREPLIDACATYSDPTALLAALEADTQSIEAHRRGRVFKRAAELFRAEGKDEAAPRCEVQASVFDFDVMDLKQRAEGHGRFEPMFEIGGGGYPHVDAFDEAAVAVIAEALESTANPIHRAQFGDFLWEKRLDDLAARAAVQAYRKAATLE
jgi:hypothetical protein